MGYSGTIKQEHCVNCDMTVQLLYSEQTVMSQLPVGELHLLLVSKMNWQDAIKSLQPLLRNEQFNHVTLNRTTRLLARLFATPVSLDINDVRSRANR